MLLLFLLYVILSFCIYCRVGQEDNKKLSDFQINAIKQKSLELKNRFDTFFYDVNCDTTDFKTQSKIINPKHIFYLYSNGNDNFRS